MGNKQGEEREGKDGKCDRRGGWGKMNGEVSDEKGKGEDT